MPLLVHGEVTDASIDLFDREKVFIDRVMTPLRHFPGLKVVFEHITTKDAADYVRDADAAPARRDDRASPAVQPQRAVRRRDSPALLLPAGAGNARRIASRWSNRDVGQPALLPGHRQRTARARATRRKPRAAVRAATALHARSNCMRKRSTPPARSTSWRASRASSAPISTGCRAGRTVTLRREAWELPREIFAGDTPVVPLRMRDDRLEAGVSHRASHEPGPCLRRAVLECASQSRPVAASRARGRESPDSTGQGDG